jgi:hypothetical protein
LRRIVQYQAAGEHVAERIMEAGQRVSCGLPEITFSASQTITGTTSSPRATSNTRANDSGSEDILIATPSIVHTPSFISIPFLVPNFLHSPIHSTTSTSTGRTVSPVSTRSVRATSGGWNPSDCEAVEWRSDETRGLRGHGRYVQRCLDGNVVRRGEGRIESSTQY